MTKDYANGKIYRIVSATGKQYVGSTTETLSQRLARHRRYGMDGKNKGVSSVVLLTEDPNAKIILVENYPCQNSEELRAREQYWIENIEGGCVNKVRAHTTPEVIQQQARQRAADKKEEIAAYKAQWFQERYEPQFHNRLNQLFKTEEDKQEEEKIRKEKKSNCDKRYREENQEELSNYFKDRYANDEDYKTRVKARVKAWATEMVECECGTTIQRGTMRFHIKSKKHAELMNA